MFFSLQNKFFLILLFSSDNENRFIKSFSIDANGGQITQVEVKEHDLYYGGNQSLADLDGNTFILSYQGHGTDGFIKTFNVRASDQSAPAIVSSSLAAAQLRASDDPSAPRSAQLPSNAAGMGDSGAREVLRRIARVDQGPSTVPLAVAVTALI